MIVTFYSYKGGVGRSFCLANVAVQLARWGNRVLCVDWDLEAPGLHEYFRGRLPAEPKAGVVELVTADGPIEWRDAVLPVRIDGVDGLDLLPAGRMDADYVDRVQAISWPQLYAEHDLGWRIEQLADELRAEYDHVLIDSRTGITDIGGICTAQLPDALVLCLTPNRQNLDGATDVARRAAAARNHLPYDKSALLVLPVVSRFDGREEYERAHHWRQTITEYCTPLYDNWVPKQVDRVNVVARTTIPYLPYWSFGEELPAITENSANPEMVTHYLDNIAALIAHDLADADILTASRDIYVARARALRWVETDVTPDIAVFAPDGQATQVRAALAALGLHVAPDVPPMELPAGTRAAVVIGGRPREVDEMVELFRAQRIVSLTLVSGIPPQEAAITAAQGLAVMLRDLPPHWAAALVKVGEWHLAAGAVDHARNVLELAEAIAPGTPDAGWLGARIAFQDGDYPAIITALADAPDLDGPQLTMLGRAYAAEGMPEDAWRVLQRALVLAEPAAAVDIRRELAVLAAQAGDDSLAVKHLTRALADAGDGTALALEVAVQLAVLQQRRGLPLQAEEILRGVVGSGGPVTIRLEASQHLASLLEQRGDLMTVAMWALAAEFAAEADDIDAMTDAVRAVLRTWELHSKPLSDMLSLVTRVREQADGGKRDRDSASLRELAGLLRIELADLSEAAQELDRGLVLFRRLRDQAGVARCLIHLARVDRRMDRADRAAARLAEAISLLPGLRGAQADVVRDLIARSSLR